MIRKIMAVYKCDLEQQEEATDLFSQLLAARDRLLERDMSASNIQMLAAPCIDLQNGD